MEYHCIRCNKWWNYPAKKCILCHGDVVEVLEMKYKIIGYTEVFIPSENHKRAPYFVYLLESEEGNRKIIKSYDDHSIGDSIDPDLELI